MLRTFTQLLLASGSPRRREMIAQLGLSYDAASPDVDETTTPGETPSAYVTRVTRAKMDAICVSHAPVLANYGAVLTADTVVAVGDRILGKPTSEADALEMVRSLSGKTHQVLSCYLLRNAKGDEERIRLVSTDVEFRELVEHELRDYVATGEGLDKAGAYAIQGRAAAFVRAIHGSYSSVVGLPLSELVEDLRELRILGSES